MFVKINLAVFNHISTSTNDTRGIFDHISVIEKFCEKYSIEFSVSYVLDPKALNFLIEGFDETSSQVILDFCQKHKKMVCVVMTEHLTIDTRGELRFGTYALNDREYIPNIDKRVYSLYSMVEYIMGFVTLGELPKLENLDKIFNKSQVYRMHFPDVIPIKQRDFVPKYDLSFTGYITSYREEVLTKLKKNYKVIYHNITGNNKERKRNVQLGSVSLNIPQNSHWIWISPMRVIFCLEIGVPCVHIGEGDDTLFYRDVLSWATIDQVLSDPDTAYLRQVEAFNNLKYDVNHIMQFLNKWALMEL